MAFLSGFLVYKQGAVDLDLEAVAASGGLGVAADEFHAFIGVVDRDAEALFSQIIAHGVDEFAAAGRSIAVAEDEIAGGGFASGQFQGPFRDGAGGGHGMGADVPDCAEAIVGAVQKALKRGVVGFVVMLDPVDDLGGGEGAIIDREAGASQAANEADAGIRAGGGSYNPVGFVRPRVGQKSGVDIVDGAVEVDITSGEMRAEQGRAMVRGRREEVVHIAVFHLGEVGQGAGVAEIFGVFAATVGGVNDQGQRRVRVFEGEGPVRLLQILRSVQGENPCCFSRRSLLLLRR